MECLLATPQLNSAFPPLGSLEGVTYVVSPNALAILEEINYKLTYEDQTLCTFRRAIGFGQNVHSDLIPILKNTKDESVLDSVIRILVNLTVPLECLFSVDVMYSTEVERHTVFELKELLHTSKEAFTDPKSTNSVLEYMKHIFESDLKLSPQKCKQINNCLLLLRNILHIPETNADLIMHAIQASGRTMQNSIIWNLFIQSIDKVLLYLMTCPQRSFWCVAMVELVSVIYKDQTHMAIIVGDARKFKPSISAQTNLKVTECINSTYEKEIPKISAIKLGFKTPHLGQLQLTKGKCYHKKLEYPSSKSELPDCGYVPHVANRESISTSSNEDDRPQGKRQQQKPPCNKKPRKGNRRHRTVLSVLNTKELRRKKFLKRSKSHLINKKVSVQHIPTDEDISNLLKKFTVAFLLKGYGYLVEELNVQLLVNSKIPIDTSHFFWLIAYFLKFAAQLELDMEHIGTILTYDVIRYLAHEGVSLCEKFELNAHKEGSDLKNYLGQIHLVVTAIREFLQAIETYNNITHLSNDRRAELCRLQLQISSTKDIRCLFVLLLRRFNPSTHTKQYLLDLVVTNHKLLLILDSTAKLVEQDKFCISEHVSQFATIEIMNCYGILLEDFNTNGKFVNDCIFTMMHHVGGDLNQVCVLFQPIILKTYSRIWETEYELCDDWSDLMDYVIYRFLNISQKSPLNISRTLLTEMTKENNLENTVLRRMCTPYYFS